jgi:hypothetical protein
VSVTTQSRTETLPIGPRRGRSKWILVAVLVLGLAAFFVQRAVSDGTGTPYGSDAVDPHVQLTIVKPADAQAAVDRMAGPRRLTAPVGSWIEQEIVGRLTLRTPSNAPRHAQYVLFVIDNDAHRPVQDIYGVGPTGAQVSQGWDGRSADIAKKYDWLAALGEIRNPDGGFSDPGAAVSWRPDTAGPVTFVAPLRRGSLPITQPARQLTVALVFLGEDGRVYWAKRLTV